MHQCGGAMNRATREPSRKRLIPMPALITMRGSCEFFDVNDATELQKIVGQPLRVDAESVVSHLNLLAESFLLHYAHRHAPTSDSKTAEWCEALVGDIGALLDVLGMSDAGYPELRMK